MESIAQLFRKSITKKEKYRAKRRKILRQKTSLSRYNKVRRQVAGVDGKIVEATLKTKNSYRAVTISPDSVRHMLHRVVERAGIPKVRFHDLRHTFATIALQNGVDIKTISGMLGHFSDGFTLDTYAHVTTTAQKEAAQTRGNVLSM